MCKMSATSSNQINIANSIKNNKDLEAGYTYISISADYACFERCRVSEVIGLVDGFNIE